MLSALQFIAHYNKYVYIEFNKLENQYTVQNYRYYATNRQCIFAQPEEKWANQYFFFFAFVTAARMSFVLIFGEGHQGNEKQSLTSSQNQNPLLIHVSIACEQQTHFWLSLLSRKCVCLSCRHKMLSAI